jgi:hypothetical protein
MAQEFCMRLASRSTLAAFAVLTALAAVRDGADAAEAPSIVVPGRRDVPVIINGVDAGGGVAWRDWGLARPGVPVEVEPGPYLIMAPPPPNAYYPATGRRPPYGRKEIDPGPNRVLPPPAEPFHRSWSSSPSAAVETAPPPAVGSAYPPASVRDRVRHARRQARQHTRRNPLTHR